MGSNSTASAPVVAATIIGGAAFIGSVLSLIGVWLVQAKTAQREREAKEREAKDKRVHQWHEFQLRTLLDLQDALKLMYVLPCRRVVIGEEVVRRTTVEANANFQDGLKEMATGILQASDDLRMAFFNVKVLAARVDDEIVSSLVERLCNEAILASKGSSEEFSKSKVPLMDAFEAANTAIRERIVALKPIS